MSHTGLLHNYSILFLDTLDVKILRIMSKEKMFLIPSSYNPV